MKLDTLLHFGVLGIVLSVGMTVHPNQAFADWIKCATEGGTCSFLGIHSVRYGIGSSWVNKDVNAKIACNNTAFGSDPAPGYVKECDVYYVTVTNPSPTPSPTPTHSPSPSPSPTPTHSPSPSPSPTPTHSPSPSPSPTPTHSPSPSPVPSATPTGTVLSASYTTAAATSFCSSKKYPSQWDWASGFTQTARSAVPSDNLKPRIEQHRLINGVDTVVAVYQSFSSSSSCTEIWLPPTNTTGYTPEQLQKMANTGCGPFGNTPHIDLFRLWKNGDTFLVYPAVYTGKNNNIVIQPQHDIYISGQSVPVYVPDHITIQGVEKNGIRPVIYRADGGPGDYATLQGAIYLLPSTNITISNLDVTLSPNGFVNKALVYDNGGGYGGTDANGKIITGTTTLRNMRISGGREIAGGVNGVFSTTNTAGTLALENVELFNNGGNNGPAHNAYLGTSGVDPNFTVKMTGSWTHDAVYGHTFKSRAQRNIFIGNYFQGSVPQDGFAQAEAYLLDIPNGGVLVAKNNIFAKNASGVNANGMSIAYAAETVVDKRPLSIDIENNTFVTFATMFDGSHPNYPMYFRGGIPGDAAFPYPQTVVSKNLFVGYCPLGNARLDYRGNLSLSAGFTELKQDFTLTNRYSSADKSMVGMQAYKHVTQSGLLRQLATIGAED